MAIWQFNCYIIPKTNCVTELELNDDILSWKKEELSLIEIDFLEKTKSWTEDVIQYGKEDETCVQFFLIDNFTEEINCRLDLRSLSKKILEDILNYIKQIDGMILYKNKIYPPNIVEVLELIKKSEANKFCQNHRAYFDTFINSEHEK